MLVHRSLDGLSWAVFDGQAPTYVSSILLTHCQVLPKLHPSLWPILGSEPGQPDQDLRDAYKGLSQWILGYVADPGIYLHNTSQLCYWSPQGWRYEGRLIKACHGLWLTGLGEVWVCTPTFV